MSETMKNIHLRNLTAICGGVLYGDGSPGFLETEATCVVIDSRKLEPGGIFAAVRGERVDGHDFIPQVFENGALAVICERLPETLPGPCLLVEDSLAALRRIAAFYRQQLQCCVIGITGSVGKTSTKEMVASVLRQRYSVCATEGNLNNEIGVPLTLLRIREHDSCAVIEMGINHFGEMERLAEMVRPDAAILTSIGDCHLEALGDRDGVLRAKTAIFRYLQTGKTVLLNGMDEKLAAIREVNGRPPIFYGISDHDSSGPSASGSGSHGAGGVSLQVCATGVRRLGFDGSEALLTGAGAEPFPIQVPLPGEHMLLNACAAAAVGGLVLGLSGREIQSGIRAAQAVSGRSRILRTPRFTILDDCYNANPTSVRSALKLLGESPASQPGSAPVRIAVLGDMLELGKEELALHAGIGAYAKELALGGLLQELWCAGELSRAMAGAAEGGPLRVYSFGSTEELLRALPERAAAVPDVAAILVKASHGMHFERIVEALCVETP